MKLLKLFITRTIKNIDFPRTNCSPNSDEREMGLMGNYCYFEHWYDYAEQCLHTLTTYPRGFAIAYQQSVDIPESAAIRRYLLDMMCNPVCAQNVTLSHSLRSLYHCTSCRVHSYTDCNSHCMLSAEIKYTCSICFTASTNNLLVTGSNIYPINSFLCVQRPHPKS
jgi:hypothetical protein